MILRRSLLGAVKCALRVLRRELVTEVEYFIGRRRKTARRARGATTGAPCGPCVFFDDPSMQTQWDNAQ